MNFRPTTLSALRPYQATFCPIHKIEEHPDKGCGRCSLSKRDIDAEMDDSGADSNLSYE